MENQKLENLFEELSVVEVEDRLAFGSTAGRCAEAAAIVE